MAQPFLRQRSCIETPNKAASEAPLIPDNLLPYLESRTAKHNSGEITANDLYTQRLELIKENVNRLGVTNVHIRNFDATIHKKLELIKQPFDRADGEKKLQQKLLEIEQKTL